MVAEAVQSYAHAVGVATRHMGQSHPLTQSFRVASEVASRRHHTTGRLLPSEPCQDVFEQQGWAQNRPDCPACASPVSTRCAARCAWAARCGGRTPLA